MKALLCIFFAFSLFNYNATAQITFRGCTTVLGAQNFTLIQTGTTNDAGTIRNTYESMPADFTQSCPAGVCEIRIMWNTGTSRWEVQLDNDGPVGAADYTTACLYFNTSASFPNPPDLSLGSWQDCSGGNCPVSQFVTMSGDVQSSVSTCSDPTVPTITYAPTSICEGSTTTLTISGTLNDATNWHIYTGTCGGTLVGTTASSSFVVTPSSPSTTYFVRGEDGAGCVNEATGNCGSVVVTVNPIPNSAINTPSTTTVCNGNPVTLTSVLSTGNQWFLNGNAIGGATGQTFAATTGGNYTVESTINGCSSGQSGIVVIGEITMPPTVISASSTTFCTGGSVTLTSTTAPTIQWFVNGVPLVGATSQTLVAVGAGVYSVEASNNGCTSNSNLLTIVENPIPSTPTISTPSTTVICNGVLVTLTSTASTGNQWFLNGNAIGGATSQTFAAAAGGNYTVTSTVNGCTSSASGIVTLSEIIIQPIASASSAVICTGDTTTLTSSITSGIQWFLNGNLLVGATNQTFSATTGGIYMVEATNGGCSAFSNPLTIVVNPTPVTPVINASGSTTFCTGESVTFSTTASTGNQWFLNGSAIGGATNQTLVATTAGNYSVEFTDNGCSNTSAIIAVTVNNPVAISQTFVECAGSSITVGSNIYTASGTYLDTLVAANGCDSIMTTDLTILSPVDTTITATLPTLTANASTATYQWVNCDSSYMPLAGATTQAYTPTANGNYAVIITDGNCSDTSSCYAVLITGIKNNKLTKMLTLFPNPTSGNLSLELGQVFSTVTIRVTSVTGQHLSTKTFKSTDKIDFNIEGIAGVYLLEITTNEGDTTTIKVLKK